MDNNNKIIGEWFLPASPNERVHGTLYINRNDRLSLELYGSLTSDNFFSELVDQELILGLSSKSEQITLYNCLMRNSGGATLIQGRESGKPSVIYTITFALIGIHADSSTELMFDHISSEIFNLDEWVGISGFINLKPDFEKLHNHEISVEYKLPEPIVFKIDNQSTGKFNFVANHPGLSRYQKSVSINQRVQFQVDTKSEMNIKSLLSYLFRFQNFLILALYRSTYPLSVTLRGERHKEELPDRKSYRKNIELYFSPSNYKEYEKPQYDRDMLFSYRLIQEKFPHIIKEWFAKYELLKPAFNLLFEQFYNGNRFNENTFLNLAQSAETFHARIHNHTKIPKEEYKKMREEIIKLTPSKYHKWLKDQFKFGNNLNLHSRLEELTKKYTNEILDKVIPVKDLFIKQVKHSRNYYTHYSSDGKKKALKGSDLFYLSERLKILLVCAFLMEVGFNKELLTTCLDNIKWRKFNHLANWRDEK